jgi:hypothetical protein
MKIYKQTDGRICQALQYGVDPEAENYVKKCYIGYDKKITKVPSDMLGTPKDTFFAVKTESGWCKIEDKDFIVDKNNEILVISHSIFKISFTEI